MGIEERIAERKKIRAKQKGRIWRKNAFKMLCEIQDDYLEHRIESDKVQEGILKDIQGNTALMADRNIEKILTEDMN